MELAPAVSQLAEGHTASFEQLRALTLGWGESNQQVAATISTAEGTTQAAQAAVQTLQVYCGLLCLCALMLLTCTVVT